MPYRAPTPPVARDVSAPARWARVKRGLARLHPDLGAHRWFRRWVGGRWAVTPVDDVMPLTWEETSDGVRRLWSAARTSWLMVDACPHGNERAYQLPRGPVIAAPQPCACEQWP